MITPLFGRKEPKDRPWEDKYGFCKLGLATVDRVETRVLVPVWKYEQIGQSCVGYSSVTQMTIYNVRHLGSRPINRWFKYDGTWLYQQSCLNDGDPNNDPPVDIGTYVWAAFWCLNHLGLKKLSEREPHMADGIANYYWCKTVDDMRTAFSLNRMVVLGTNWSANMMNPYKVGNEWWINTGGEILGGHAYCTIAASDRRQAFKMRNTWPGYPDVWFSYNMAETLLLQGGEACVAIDIV